MFGTNSSSMAIKKPFWKVETEDVIQSGFLLLDSETIGEWFKIKCLIHSQFGKVHINDLLMRGLNTESIQKLIDGGWIVDLKDGWLTEPEIQKAVENHREKSRRAGIASGMARRTKANQNEPKSKVVQKNEPKTNLVQVGSLFGKEMSPVVKDLWETYLKLREQHGFSMSEKVIRKYLIQLEEHTNEECVEALQKAIRGGKNGKPNQKLIWPEPKPEPSKIEKALEFLLQPHKVGNWDKEGTDEHNVFLTKHDYIRRWLVQMSEHKSSNQVFDNENLKIVRRAFSNKPLQYIKSGFAEATKFRHICPSPPNSKDVEKVSQLESSVTETGTNENLDFIRSLQNK